MCYLSRAYECVTMHVLPEQGLRVCHDACVTSAGPTCVSRCMCYLSRAYVCVTMHVLPEQGLRVCHDACVT
jgi:hypothetical protein